MVVLIWVMNEICDWRHHVLNENNPNVLKRCLVTKNILHSHLNFSLQKPDCNQTSFTSWCQTHGNDDGDGDDNDDDGDDSNDSGQAGVEHGDDDDDDDDHCHGDHDVMAIKIIISEIYLAWPSLPTHPLIHDDDDDD